MRRCHRFSLVTVALVASALIQAGAPAAAQEIAGVGGNLLSNPGFDTDTAGWPSPGCFTSVDAERYGWTCSVAWAHRDADRRADSGSLRLAITADQGRCVNVFQCVAVSPGAYELGGMVFLHAPGPQDQRGSVNLDVIWVEREDCQWQTALGQESASFDPAAAPEERWMPLATGRIVAPPKTRGAVVGMSACTSPLATSLETLVVNFDSVVFKPIASRSEPDPLPRPPGR